MTLDCVGLTQSGVTCFIHRNVGLKCFFRLPKCLFLWLVFFFTFVLHKVVQRQINGVLGYIYNNRIIANCPQSVPVQEF